MKRKIFCIILMFITLIWNVTPLGIKILSFFNLPRIETIKDTSIDFCLLYSVIFLAVIIIISSKEKENYSKWISGIAIILILLFYIFAIFSSLFIS